MKECCKQCGTSETVDAENLCRGCRAINNWPVDSSDQDICYCDETTECWICRPQSIIQELQIEIEALEIARTHAFSWGELDDLDSAICKKIQELRTASGRLARKRPAVSIEF